MRNLLFIIFISFCGLTFAQKRINYGGQLSLDFNYRLLKNDVDNFNSNQDNIKLRNNTEKMSLRFTSGFVIGFNFTERITFNSGLLYSMKGYDWSGEFIMARSGGFFETVKIKGYFLDHLVEIPTLFTYKFGNSKKGISLNLGAYHGFYFQTNSYSKWEFTDGETGQNSSQHSNFSPYRIQGALGVNYIFSLFKNEDSFCTIGPELKFTLNSIVQAPIKEYPYSVGLRFTTLF